MRAVRMRRLRFLRSDFVDSRPPPDRFAHPREQRRTAVPLDDLRRRPRRHIPTSHISDAPPSRGSSPVAALPFSLGVAAIAESSCNDVPAVRSRERRGGTAIRATKRSAPSIRKRMKKKDRTDGRTGGRADKRERETVTEGERRVRPRDMSSSFSLSLLGGEPHLRTQYLGRHLRGGADAASRNPREDAAFGGCERLIQL
jgi:hypothetical protein